MQALEIKKAIIKLHKTLDNKAISEKLGVAYQSIVAYSAVLSGQGLIPKKGKVVKKKHVKVKKKESKNKPYNNIEGTAPTAGAQAYPAHSGNLSASDIVGDGTVSAIGRFLSTVDQDGYAKVEINLP